ncbi:Lipid A export ATP-binding/permease protein msbA [Pyrenophora teres f. maculata]|nr:Lipid A export ATP-binding/permease protein msbA [Pyrenophora teres f. maculata]
MLFQSLTLVIGAYVVAFIKSPLLTLVASASLPFILVVYGALFPLFMRIHKITEKHYDDASAMAFEMFSSIRNIVAFGAEAKLARQHEDMLDKAAKNERKAAPLMGLMMSPMMVGQYSTFAIAFWFGIKRYSEGKEANVRTITVVLFSVMMALMNINRVVSPMIAIAKAATAATVLFVTIDAPVPNTAGLKEPDITADADITFDNVCFSYPSRPDVQILKGLDLAFEAGKVTAIVGPSGSVDLKWWRSQIGLVQQEPFLFNDTLYNNVAFGLSGTSYEGLPKEEKMKMVEEACREAYAEEFITKLPDGYDTMVGESGIKLLGGQRQRISIVRSIIKQPPVLILDEATSAIDVRTERIVQQALDRVSKNRTTIVIAYRLSTIRRADKIVVLRQGKLVEQGTHEDLLKIDAGVYYGLIHAQEIAMEAEHTDDDNVLEKVKTTRSEVIEEHTVSSHTSESAEPEYKQQGLLRSFGRLIYEQRQHWILYALAIAGILASGAVFPL